MADATEPYVKSLEDELDWKLLDQLYGATLQVSNFCFEIKKFCVTTLFVVITVLAKFTQDKLDHSIFVTAVIITILFWFLDSVSFYYQVKLRGMMNSIRESIHKRSKTQIISNTISQAIQPDRIANKQYKLVFDAVFNHSMWLYGILSALTAIFWTAYGLGWLK